MLPKTAGLSADSHGELDIDGEDVRRMPELLRMKLEVQQFTMFLSQSKLKSLDLRCGTVPYIIQIQQSAEAASGS